MPRRYQHLCDVPKSKRLKNNPYAIRGIKLQRLEGGLVTRRQLPNGNILVTTIDETGKQTETIEPTHAVVPSQADLISQRLAEIGMSVHAFAVAMGKSHSYIWNVVHGQRRMTAPETIARTASILGVPQDRLYVSAKHLPPDVWVILQRRPQLVQAVRALNARLDREAQHATR